MDEVRRNDLLPTAKRMADDDYLLLDGATEGVRKIQARRLVQELGIRKNVVNEGAAGDGVTNNASIFASLFAAPGAYYIPAGRYVVTLASNFSDLIKIGSGVDLLLDPQAIIEFTEPAVPGLLIFEQTGVRIQGGAFEFSGAYSHDSETGVLYANGTKVNASKFALLDVLGIREQGSGDQSYNIGLDCCASTLSIFGGSDIALLDLVIRGKTIINQQHTAISISPNANYTAAENIQIIRPCINDFTMGIIPGRGVNKLYIENPRFGRFGELHTSPGHAIYASANDKSPPNEDITVIGAYDDGLFVGDQLTPPRRDRHTPSFKFRKGKNIRMLNTVSKRPSGCFDALGVENGSFIGADIAPHPLHYGSTHNLIRCANVNPSLYNIKNQNVVFEAITIRAHDNNDVPLQFDRLENSNNINIRATVHRAGNGTAKPSILVFGADSGTFEITYLAEEAHGPDEPIVMIRESVKNVHGWLLTNFDPRIAIANSSTVARISINGRAAFLPLSASPRSPVPYEIARADRVNWDPLGKGNGGSYLVMRNDANNGWVAVDGQG